MKRSSLQREYEIGILILMFFLVFNAWMNWNLSDFVSNGKLICQIPFIFLLPFSFILMREDSERTWEWQSMEIGKLKNSINRSNFALLFTTYFIPLLPLSQWKMNSNFQFVRIFLSMWITFLANSFTFCAPVNISSE